MKYFAIVLRILIVIIWFKMLAMSGLAPQTEGFCTGIWFIVVGLYLTLQAMAWPKALLCPFTASCREKNGCKS